MITLINKQRRKRTFNLDHPAFASQYRVMKMTVDEEARDVARRPRRIQKQVCGALTLLAGEKRHNLPDQIIKVPTIAKAIADGTLTFLKVSVEEKKATTAAKDKPKRRSRKR